MTRRGLVLFAAMCVIWGIPYLLIKEAVAGLTPAALVFWRTTIGAALLLPAALLRRQLAPLLPHWRIVVAYTAVEIAVPWWLLSDAERRLSSSLTGLLVAAVPLIGAVLARLTGGHEPLGTRRLVGLVTGLVGVAALLGLAVPRGDLGAVGEVVLVAVGYATGPLIIARRLRDLPALGVVTASLVLSALVYLPVAVAGRALPPASLRVTGSLVALGLVCTALAFLLFFALIAEIGPVRATVITYVNPAVAVALGVLLLHESFTAATAVGFVLILAGSFLATRPARRRAEAARVAAGVSVP